MADIFISYKKEDAGRVIRMVEALRAEGFDVWWDHGIKAGTNGIAPSTRSSTPPRS